MTTRPSSRSSLGTSLELPSLAAGETLLYTRSKADARGRVARGEAAAAILVRPTLLTEIAVAGCREPHAAEINGRLSQAALEG